MTLQDLCKYYVSCIALESNTTLRVSLKNSTSFIELSHLNDSVLTNSDISTFLSSNQEKGHDLLVGYPLLKIGCNLSPIFIIRLSYNDGSHSGNKGYRFDKALTINKDIIDRYSTNEKTENIFELRQLEAELGLSVDANVFDKISGIVYLLRTIRPNWEWLEELNPNELTKGTIYPHCQDGILNRAIIIAKEPTPYTVGLSNELAQLSQVQMLNAQYSILGKILNNQINNCTITHEPVLEVLPLNQEQKEAIKIALCSDVTLIAGPPGTGKTQVVANLLVNAAYNGLTVLFTSKNNNAVDVVVDRVNKIKKSLPIVLRYEKSTKQSLMEYTQIWERAVVNDPSDESLIQQYKGAYANTEKHLVQKQKILELRNRMDMLEQQIDCLRGMYADFIGQLSDKNVCDIENAYSSYIQCAFKHKKGPTSIFQWLFKTIYIRKINKNFTNAIEHLNSIMMQYHKGLNVFVGMSEREQLHYDLVYNTLISNLKKIANYNFTLRQLQESASLEQLDQMLLHDHTLMQNIAEKIWNDWLKQHTKLYSSANRAAMHHYFSLLEHDKVDEIPMILRKLIPIGAITSLSARRRIPYIEGFYDMLIIDEASQCDIASMIPLMIRAKRLVIIGDKQQLSHICLLNNQTDINLMNKYNIADARWSYRANSIYDLVESVTPSDCIIQLRDHHRSFLDIIQFSNQEFYSNSLRIATDYRRLLSPKTDKGPVMGMQWVNVVGRTIRPAEGGAYNIKEVESVICTLRHLSKDLHFMGSIGVTTPFHLQAEMILQALEGDSELRNSLELHNQLLVDTVHKFQGDERDVIIFSPVVSIGTTKQSLSFLKSTGNLFNVAITRARALLVTVGDKDYCKHCSVSYLEHFAAYNVGESAPVESSEWEHILQRALSAVGIPVTAQYHVDKYYLDLALFHNNKKLDIEVDGEMYHKAWDNELCYKDQIRNQTLIQQGWDIRRFWVQQVRDELPWCVEQIQKWIND